MDWYYTAGSERHGPVDEFTLRAMIASGEIARDSLVGNENLLDWIPAAQIGLLWETGSVENVDELSVAFRMVFFCLLIARFPLIFIAHIMPIYTAGASIWIYYGILGLMITSGWLALREQRGGEDHRIWWCIAIPLGVMLMFFINHLSVQFGGSLWIYSTEKAEYNLITLYGLMVAFMELVCGVYGLKRLAT